MPLAGLLDPSLSAWVAIIAHVLIKRRVATGPRAPLPLARTPRTSWLRCADTHVQQCHSIAFLHVDDLPRLAVDAAGHASPGIRPAAVRLPVVPPGAAVRGPVAFLAGVTEPRAVAVPGRAGAHVRAGHAGGPCPVPPAVLQPPAVAHRRVDVVALTAAAAVGTDSGIGASGPTAGPCVQPLPGGAGPRGNTGPAGRPGALAPCVCGCPPIADLRIDELPGGAGGARNAHRWVPYRGAIACRVVAVLAPSAHVRVAAGFAGWAPTGAPSVHCPAPVAHSGVNVKACGAGRAVHTGSVIRWCCPVTSADVEKLPGRAVHPAPLASSITPSAITHISLEVLPLRARGSATDARAVRDRRPRAASDVLPRPTGGASLADRAGPPLSVLTWAVVRIIPGTARNRARPTSAGGEPGPTVTWALVNVLAGGAGARKARRTGPHIVRSGAVACALQRAPGHIDVFRPGARPAGGTAGGANNVCSASSIARPIQEGPRAALDSALGTCYHWLKGGPRASDPVLIGGANWRDAIVASKSRRAIDESATTARDVLPLGTYSRGTTS